MNILIQTFAYVVIGLVVAASFQYEKQAFHHLLSQLGSAETSWIWAAVIAGAFNVGKILIFKSIIMAKSKSFSYLWKSYLAASLLVINSFICTLCVMSYSLESPQLGSLVTELKQHQSEAASQKQQALIQKFESLKATLVTQYEQDHQAIQSEFQAQINEYNTQLVQERERRDPITGVFKGKRYREIERLLKQEADSRGAAYEKLRLVHGKKISALNAQLEVELQVLADESASAFDGLTADKVKEAGSKRMQDPMLGALVTVINDVFDWQFKYKAVVILFSMLIAFLIELLNFALLQFIYRLDDGEDEPTRGLHLVTSNTQQPLEVA